MTVLHLVVATSTNARLFVHVKLCRCVVGTNPTEARITSGARRKHDAEPGRWSSEVSVRKLRWNCPVWLANSLRKLRDRAGALQARAKRESSQVSPISWLRLAAADVLSWSESRLGPEPTPERAGATPFGSDPRQRRRSIAQTQSPRFPSR